jgi:hypothetical protein
MKILMSGVHMKTMNMAGRRESTIPSVISALRSLILDVRAYGFSSAVSALLRDLRT